MLELETSVGSALCNWVLTSAGIGGSFCNLPDSILDGISPYSAFGLYDITSINIIIHTNRIESICFDLNCRAQLDG